MPTYHELSTSHLRQALQLREQIETLQQKLDALLGGSSAGTVAKTKGAVGRPPGKRTMSAAARAKIAAAAKARWAKLKGTSAPAKAAPAKAAPAKSAPTKSTAPTKPVAKKAGGLTPEGRAKLAAAMKARWAARKKGAPAPTAKKEA